MATIPIPRSYSQVLGDMIDAFLSRFGLRSLKVGSPVLSILESVAQSQLRSSDDIFTLLDAISLDNATGDALDRIGADESTPRITQGPASGTVTITDTSFTKNSTKIFQGTPAPLIGSTAVNVVDASTMPATGSVYLGRGQSSYEGPIAYTSKVNNGNYWTLNLASGTLRFHNQGESVVLAQGGDRLVPAGTIVQTPQGNVSQSIQFKTLFSSTISDGETSITGVLVVAVTPGISGNVAANAVNGFSSAPFNGATVVNPLPFTNGTPVEDDDTFRERIRQARQSRTKGTALAIQTNAVGVTSTDENKRVLSASVVTATGAPTTLYIDDGTGYEMVATGVAIESLADSALGGEQYFKVSKRPIAKAYVQSANSAPYALASGMKLGFAVDGVTTEHSFNGTDFQNPANATAYEVVASINADANLNWKARTINGGTQVVITAKNDTNESIQNTIVLDGIDANPFMLFSSTLARTMRLYKDDKLLFKDGRLAQITSNTSSLWSNMSGPQALVLAVDGITLKFDGTMFPKFTDQDFINAATGYATLGKNTPTAWAAVFNLRIPGITASVSASNVLLTSNRGHSSTASVQIISGDLITNNMFVAATATGLNSDFVLNRNTGELSLAVGLNSGSKLAAGTTQTRAFLNTPTISTVNLLAQANMWFALDASATIIPTGITTATSFTFTSSATGYGFQEKCTSTTAVFQNVLPGDFVIFWDPAISASLFGTYRVTAVDPAFFYFYFEKATSYAAGPLTLTASGMMFARTQTDLPLQKASIASGNAYTASSLAPAFSLAGAVDSTYRTNILRVRTNTFSTLNGDIALVAADANAQLIGLTLANATKNLTGHMASIESVNSEIGTPDFQAARAAAVTSGTQVTITRLPNTSPSTGSMMYGLRADQTANVDLTSLRVSSQFGFRTTLASATVNGGNWDLVLNNAPEQTWLVTDRMMFANPFMMAPDDQFTVLVDGDTTLKRYAINMWRTIKPTTNNYGTTNSFTDGDNGNQSLSVAFGGAYNFNDFAVYMPARGKTDNASLTKAILWRYYRLGPDGNNARVQYQNPKAPNLPVSFNINNTTNATCDIGLVLSSGALRSGQTIRLSSFIGYAITGSGSGVATITNILGFAVATAQLTGNVVTLTLTLPSGVTNHGLITGNVIYLNSSDGTITSGAKTLTGSTATTVTYAQTAANYGPVSNIGTVSNDPAGEVTLTGSNIVAGDFFYWAGWPQATTPAMRVATIDGSAKSQYWTGIIPWSGSNQTTVTWSANNVGDPTQVLFYANPAQTSSALVTAFQALSNPIVKATLIGDGTGIIDRSSDETAGASPTFTNLVDGVNYVKTTTPPGANYTLVFKNAVDATLVTSSDWLNETVRICPLTAASITSWFNTLGVTGLSSAAEISASSSASKVQLASLTAGSIGSLQVQGGTSNLATAGVVGSAITTPAGLVCQVPIANIVGMFAGCYVSVDNLNVMPRTNVFDLNTNLTSISAGGVFTFNGGGTAVVTQRSATSNVGLKFEKQGKFICITDTTLGTHNLNLTSVVEGDWVNIVAPAAPTSMTQIASGNIGLFRVVRVLKPYFGASPGEIWIENINVTPQNLAEVDITFIAPNSVLPGDTINISTSLWGAANLGQWTVTTVPGLSVGGSLFSFTVSTTTKAITAVGAVGALGTANANLVQCIESKPSHFIKHILGIAQNALSPTTLADIKFDSSAGVGVINASAGTILTVQDKFGFATTVSNGIDGYQYNTGLIKAVNQVEYGDPADPATYPGVIAAGALVNIEGAPIKRIQVSIALRVRSGANTTFIQQSAQSAVAAVINGTGVGQSIALIDIANAAKVPGVISVIMLSPQMITGTDLISVQPFEKPRVVVLSTDVLISFVGS
jgi:hypothetical protein